MRLFVQRDFRAREACDPPGVGRVAARSAGRGGGRGAPAAAAALAAAAPAPRLADTHVH